MRRSTGVLGLLYLLGSTAQGATVEIHGTYRYQNYNAETGKPFTNAIGGVRQWGEFTFEVLLTRTGFQISVTNSEDACLWTQLVFDGTHMFTMAPYEPPFVLPGETRSNTIFATVSKGNQYLPYVGDWARAEIPWVTYALRPSEARTNLSGLVDIPLPWETPRRKLLAYGWRWEIVPATDSYFIASAASFGMFVSISRNPQSCCTRNSTTRRISQQNTCALPPCGIGSKSVPDLWTQSTSARNGTRPTG